MEKAESIRIYYNVKKTKNSHKIHKDINDLQCTVAHKANQAEPSRGSLQVTETTERCRTKFAAGCLPQWHLEWDLWVSTDPWQGDKKRFSLAVDVDVKDVKAEKI